MVWLLYIAFALLVAILFAYVGYMLLICFRQSSYVYHPVHDIVLTPENVGLAYEEVNMKTSDGETIAGWFVPAENTRGTVLFCHGNASNVGTCIDHIQTFHRLNMNILVFDYRGYGKSTGKPTEAGTYEDVSAVWRYLTEDRGIPSDTIMAFGYSLGGCIAAWVAAYKGVGCLALLSSFTTMADLAADLYPYMPIRWLCRFSYNTLDAVKKIKCPLLVAHSVDDEMIFYAHGEKIFDAAPEPKSFLKMHGGHSSCISETGEAYVKALDDFISTSLKS